MTAPYLVALYGGSILVFAYIVSRMGKRRLAAVAVIWPLYLAFWALVELIDLVGDLGEKHAKESGPASTRAR